MCLITKAPGVGRAFIQILKTSKLRMDHKMVWCLDFARERNVIFFAVVTLSGRFKKPKVCHVHIEKLLYNFNPGEFYAHLIVLRVNQFLFQAESLWKTRMAFFLGI